MIRQRLVVLAGCLLLLGACSSGAVTSPPLSTTLSGATTTPPTTVSATAPPTTAPPTTAPPTTAPPTTALATNGPATEQSPTAPISSAAGSTGPATLTPAALGDLTISTVATGLAAPWGVAFLPDGTAVVTGRDDASVSTITTDGTVTKVGTIVGVEPGGEGGLLGVAASPTFAQDGLLYVYYSGADGNQIDTVTFTGDEIGNQTTGLTGIPRAGIHNGGRLAFGPDGLLYAGTGDAGQRPNAQDPNSLGGKILRMTPGFEPAAGNPGNGLVYSLGHRNVQGLAFDATDRLWAAEFGQNTWDELNLIVAGGNFGWPEIEGPGARAGFVEPQRVWPTDEASPSGIAFWQGSIWMAGLRGERLWQIPIIESESGPTTGEPVAHLTNVYGRLRTVAAAPDGSLWLTTSNTDGRGDVRDGDDRILRVQVGA